MQLLEIGVVKMGKIRLLDKDIVGKIAAGEVIERPASVVKELLENSLDAHATKISVEVKEGGKSLIRVEDDGEGIAEDDCNLIAERHSTSKLSSADDLFNIHSFGFRGEALSSIAAVSELTIKSCTKDTIIGTKLSLSHGERKIEDTACPKGTIVEVKSLFYNTPARKKYLKGIEHELREIADIITRYALSYPEVSFRLIHDGREIINSPASAEALSGISNLYGNNVAKNLLKVSHSQAGIQTSGFVSRPSLTKPNRDSESIFINRRYIKSKLIGDAINQAYHTLLMVGRHPIAILNITIEPRELDVNVHPSKREIKLSHEEQVYDAVYSAVKNTLSENELIKEVENQKVRQDVLISKQEMPKASGKKPGSSLSQSFGTASSKYSPNKQDQLMLKETDEKVRKRNLPEMRIVGQLHKTYIIAEGDNCIYLIDQHAAQERVNYERFMEQLKAKLETQSLLEPIIIELSPRQFSLVMANLELLKRLGFETEEFGANTLTIKTYPIILPGQDLQLIIDLIDELETARNKITEEKERLLIMRACKASVKANQALTTTELAKILDELSAAESPYTCPHGRPILIRLTLYELEKMFKRK